MINHLSVDGAEAEPFEMDGDALVLVHNVKYAKNNACEIGRFYTEGSLRGVPTFLHMNSLVRNICMSRSVGQGEYKPTTIEIDQSCSNLVILLHILRLANDPAAEWVNSIVLDPVSARTAVASAYSISGDDRRKAQITNMFSIGGRPFIEQSVIDKVIADDVSDVAPCTIDIAKACITGVIYGQSYESMLATNSLIMNSAEHSDVLVHLRTIMNRFADIISTVDAHVLIDNFGISWATCTRFADQLGKHANGNLSAISYMLQTIEARITTTAMEACKDVLQGVCAYVFDGFYVDMPMNTAVDPEKIRDIQEKTKAELGMQTLIFCAKTQPCLKVCQGDLAITQNVFRMRERIHEVVDIRMQMDVKFDRDFMFNIYTLLDINGAGCIDPMDDESKQTLQTLGMYLSKFVVHNSSQSGQYISISWDPVIPFHIISTGIITEKHRGEMAYLTFQPHNETKPKTWLEVLCSVLPTRVTFQHLAKPDGYNTDALRVPFGIKDHILTDFTFSLQRECKIRRDNYFLKDISYPQGIDNTAGLRLLHTILKLEFILCGYDSKAFVFLHRLIAVRVTRINEMIPIIIQCSSAKQGVGKNTFFEKLIGRLMLGDISNRFSKDGSFSGSQSGCDDLLNAQSLEPVLSVTYTASSMVGARFNETEAGKNLMIYDECARTDKTLQAQVKAKTTNPTLSVECKFKEVVMIMNMALSVFLSNYPISIPIEANCRRNFVIRVSDMAPKMSVGSLKRMHALIEAPLFRWMYYRHLSSCINIPDNLEDLQHDIPVTDHMRAMMAVSDEMVTGIITALSDHRDVASLPPGTRLVFTKNVIQEALFATSPNMRNVRWETITNRLVGSSVGPMTQTVGVIVLDPNREINQFTFDDRALIHNPSQIKMGMDFTTAITAHRNSQATMMLNAPANLAAAHARYVNEALPLLRTAFPFDLAFLQQVALADLEGWR